MNKTKELIIRGFVAGVMGNIPKTATCQILKNSRVSRLKCSDLLAGVFINPRKAKTKKGVIFSVVSDFLVAGINGIGYAFLLNYTGKNKAVFKGIATGFIYFLLYRSIIVKFGKGKIYSKDLKTNLLLGINSSIWGIFTALLIKSIEHIKLFKPKSPKNNFSLENKVPLPQNEKTTSVYYG